MSRIRRQVSINLDDGVFLRLQQEADQKGMSLGGMARVILATALGVTTTTIPRAPRKPAGERVNAATPTTQQSALSRFI